MTASISTKPRRVAPHATPRIPRMLSLLGAVAVAAALLLGLSGTAQASAGVSRSAGVPYYELRPLSNPNMCLDVAHASVVHGANVLQGTCWGGANQRWQLVDAGGGYVQLHPLSAPHMCLDVAWGSTAHGADVIQATCSRGTNQHWAVQRAAGFHEVWARHSGKCLDVAHASVVHGADVIQGTCWGGANQRWELRFAGTW
jgi:hypothetical protein